MNESQRKMQREYRATRKERDNELKRKWRIANGEKEKEYSRRKREKARAAFLALPIDEQIRLHEIQRQKNHERYLASRERNPNTDHEKYLRNKEHIKEVNKRWKQEHPYVTRMYVKRWAEKNKDKLKAQIDAKRVEKCFFQSLAVVSSVSQNLDDTSFSARVSELSSEKAIKRREYDRRYRERHRIAIMRYQRDWRLKHKNDAVYQEREKKRRRQYLAEHRDEINARKRESKRLAKKRNLINSTEENTNGNA